MPPSLPAAAFTPDFRLSSATIADAAAYGATATMPSPLDIIAAEPPPSAASPAASSAAAAAYAAAEIFSFFCWLICCHGLLLLLCFFVLHARQPFPPHAFSMFSFSALSCANTPLFDISFRRSPPFRHRSLTPIF
jgi:hypothetical protein